MPTKNFTDRFPRSPKFWRRSRATNSDPRESRSGSGDSFRFQNFGEYSHRYSGHPQHFRQGNRQLGSEHSTEKSNEIPGFVWDPVKKRHFKILPDQHGQMVSGCVTNSKIRLKEMEEKRMQLIHDGNPVPIKSKLMTNTGLKIGSHLLSDLSSRQLGSRSAPQFTANILRRRVSKIGKSNSSVVKALDLDISMESVSSCHFLTASGDGKNVLGAWKLLLPANNYDLSRKSYSRIMCLDAKLDPKKATESSFGLEFQPAKQYTNAMDPYIIDFCKAPVDSSVTCVLYATTPLLPNLGGHVYLQPVPEMSSIDDTDFLGSPVYNVHLEMRESVCSCAWNSKKMRVGVGLETWGMIHDVVAERKFKLNSRGKNVLAQEFSKDGNTLFMGLRCGNIMCSDLRLPSKRMVSSLQESSTHCIKLMQDSNFLLAANLHGEMKLWDLRMSRCVVDFLGHNNSHTKVSCVVDETESLLFAAGEDGIVRGWSISCGDLLCSVPSPYPVTERSTVPKICYSNNWTGLAGTGALILGVRDELHVYESRM